MTQRPIDDEGLEPEDADPDDFSDPRNPDYDLSESAPYSYATEDEGKPWFTQRWVALIIAFIVISGLVLPYLLRF